MADTIQCIFCGKQAGSEEHIISKWILRDLDLYKLKTRIGFGVQLASKPMDQVQAPQPLGGFVTDMVCQTCNNNWMSQLEGKVKPLLSPLLQDPWPKNDRPLFESLFLHSAVLTQWLLKTACTFGAKMSVQVPKDIQKMLHQNVIAPEIMADLSYNAQSGAYVGMSKSWNCYSGEKLDVSLCSDRSFRFVWQLQHLAMRIAYFPGCQKLMIKPRHPVRLYPKFGISPSYKSDGKTRPSYYYDTLEQLEHETTYARPG